LPTDHKILIYGLYTDRYPLYFSLHANRFNMDSLFEISERLIENVPRKIIREPMEWLSRGDRMIGIKGARGVGKSTLLLQFANEKLKGKRKLYVSLDDIEFAHRGLAHFADEFVKHGGEYLLVDEVHSYQGWAREMKNIYGRYSGSAYCVHGLINASTK